MVRGRIIVGIAALLVASAASVVGLRHGSEPGPGPDPAAAVAATRAGRATDTVEGAQQRLREVPGDYDTWAALGGMYINKGRTTADPSYYPKAEGALRKSLAIHPDGNSTALIGLGALANSRHQFAQAATLARRALAVAPYSADAYGVLVDAQTQLGDATAATASAQKMLDLKPGLASYSRASYDLELRGRMTDAEALMTRALNAASDPGDVAFCRYQLGELYWQTGNLTAASAQYTAAHEADPTSLPALEGLAKVAAALGHTSQALAGYADLTARYPLPMYLFEYADLLRLAGQPDKAEQQLAVASAALQLFTANGGADDLSASQLDIEQGKPAAAVQAAEREWSRRQFVDVADALGWALHAAGDDKAALSYAQRALAHGARNATYLFHRGMIEAALGRTNDARRDLHAALALNPHFSPRYAPVATATLARLGAS